MEQIGLARVIIFAKNLNKKASFYESVFGLRRSHSEDGMLRAEMPAEVAENVENFLAR